MNGGMIIAAICGIIIGSVLIVICIVADFLEKKKIINNIKGKNIKIICDDVVPTSVRLD